MSEDSSKTASNNEILTMYNNMVNHNMGIVIRAGPAPHEPRPPLTQPSVVKTLADVAAELAYEREHGGQKKPYTPPTSTPTPEVRQLPSAVSPQTSYTPPSAPYNPPPSSGGFFSGLMGMFRR